MVFLILYQIKNIIPENYFTEIKDQFPLNNLEKDECIKDYTFIMTGFINDYMVKNRDVSRKLMIYASFCMDFM